MSDMLVAFAIGAGLGIGARLVPFAWRELQQHRKEKRSLDRLPHYEDSSFDELWAIATQLGEVSVSFHDWGLDDLTHASLRLPDKSEYQGRAKLPTDALMEIFATMDKATTRRLPKRQRHTVDAR